MVEYLAENARLRQLSRRYAEGQIPAGEYRAVRREILEALEEGHAQSEAPAEALPETPSPESAAAADATDVRLPDDATVFFKTMPPQPAGVETVDTAFAAASGWDSHTRVLALVLGISLLLAVSALVYVFAL